MGVSHSKDEDLPDHRRSASIRLPSLLRKSDDIASGPSRRGTRMSRTITATRTGSSYPYPRGHSTVLIPVGAAKSKNTTAPSGIRAPTVVSKRQPAFDRRAKGLNIPSPVPSGSEPSTADNSANVSRSETREFVEEPFKKIDEEKQSLRATVIVEALSSLQETKDDNNGSCDGEPIPCDPSTTAPERSSPMKTVFFSSSSDKTELVTTEKSVLSKSLPAPRSILKTQSMEINNKQSSAITVPSAVSQQQPKVITAGSSSTTSTTNIARPTSLLRNVTARSGAAAAAAAADSLTGIKFKNSKSTPANLKEGVAPLAESECFIVENSPAVELPPSGFPSKLPGQNKPPLPVSKLATKSSSAATTSKTGQQPKDNCKLQPSSAKFSSGSSSPSFGDKKQTANLSNFAAPSKALSYAESRLKNSSNYARTQRLIYGKADTNVKIEDNPSSVDNVTDLTNRPTIDSRVLVTTIDEQNCANQNDNSTTSGDGGDLFIDRKCVTSSESLPDAPVVVTMKTNDSSPNVVTVASGKVAATLLNITDNSGKKPISANVMSPKHEMHDSGVKTSDASTGSDTSNSKVTSPDGSLHRGLIDDEIKDQPDLTVGSQLERQSSDPTLSGNESVTNMDRNSTGPVRYRERIRKHSGIDRMTESYDSTISSASVDEDDLMLDYEGSVDLGEGADLADSLYAGSLVGRKSFKGSWRRRSSNVKRASLEVVMDEWNCLVNEVHKSSTQSQRLRSVSDVPTDSPTNCSKTIRPLKPPASLSIDCAGLPSVSVDQHTYRHLIQDVTVLKTLLFRLKRVLQEADTVNPFESSLALKNGLLKAGLDEILNDRTSTEFTKDDLREENVTLRTQVALMRQQLEEKDRIISEQKQRITELERLRTTVPPQTVTSLTKDVDKPTTANAKSSCDIMNGKLSSQTCTTDSSSLSPPHLNSPTKSVRTDL